MMNNLKFRAWDTFKKQWIIVGFHIIGETTMFDVLRQYSIPDFDNIFVTQFTSLIDKNGSELYDGDILENPNYDPEDWERCAVYYDRELARYGLLFYSLVGGEGYTGRSQSIDVFVKDGCYKIGNVFENLDLIGNCDNYFTR